MARSLIKVGKQETYKELIERFLVSDTQTKRNLILEQFEYAARVKTDL